MFSLPKPFVYTLIPTAELYSHYFLLSYLFKQRKGDRKAKQLPPSPRGWLYPDVSLSERGDLLPSLRRGEKQRGPQHDSALVRHGPPWEVPTSFHHCADTQKWVSGLTEGPSAQCLNLGSLENCSRTKTAWSGF